MQLVAYGAQDVYLSGSPEVTFFKVVYRRHTNFSVEPIEQTFNGTCDFGKTVTCEVNRNGDLVTKMYLYLELDATEAAEAGKDWGYVRRLGHAAIDEAEVEVGGSQIDQHYGEWLNIWYELTHKTGQERGYEHMIGDIPALTNVSTDAKPSHKLHIPFQFWFNRNNGLALPLIALQYHDVRIKLKLRPFRELVNHTGTVPAAQSIADGYLLVDYVYLDAEERKKFAQASHEYLIEQVQFTGAESLKNSTESYRLNFNHPSKCLIFCPKLGKYNDGSTYVDWAWDGDWEAARERVAKRVWLSKNASLTGSGSDLDEVMGGTDLSENSKPLVKAQLIFAGTVPSSSDTLASSLNNVVLLENNLTSAHLSQTVTEWSTGALTGVKSADLPKGFVVRDYTLYSTNADGTGNPLQKALLQLNGHDRFQERDGSYFNYVQPHQHWERTPADGVNSYSFALNPMEHQPSGTCNFSRIDNTTLKLWINSTATSALGSNSRMFIFCINYNVFRVMSGMGGLAYSN